jgi:biotin synthase-like enzyme
VKSRTGAGNGIVGGKPEKSVGTEYGETVNIILPEVETRSLVIHGPGVCPYAKCSYCPLFSQGKLKAFDISEFRSYIHSEASRFAPEEITSIFVSEGNLMSMDPKVLSSILKTLHDNFPFLEKVSVYGSAYAILGHNRRQMEGFRKKGLTRLHMGLESGSNRVLEILNKGVDKDGMFEAARMVKDAGIELHIYVLIGAGGAAESEEHIRETSTLINAIAPDSIELQTLVPVPGTPLFGEAELGKFQFLSAHESIREIRLFVETINGPARINCAHYSNHCQIHGRLPEDRQRLLKELEYSLSIDESLFDASGIVSIGLPN